MYLDHKEIAAQQDFQAVRDRWDPLDRQENRDDQESRVGMGKMANLDFRGHLVQWD